MKSFRILKSLDDTLCGIFKNHCATFSSKIGNSSVKISSTKFDKERLKSQRKYPVVNSFNEWDPLEEVVIGRAEGNIWPALTFDMFRRVTPDKFDYMKKQANKPYDPQFVKIAKEQVDNLVSILKSEGVIVKRPEKIDYSKIKSFVTPNFETRGYINSCPRDGAIVIGNEILEAPMSNRNRYFETEPLKKLFNHYFDNGAKWTIAPKPQMRDELYKKNFPENYLEREKLTNKGDYGLTESEIAFDAADIIRIGEDLLFGHSITTNFKGMKWLQRHLDEKYKIHRIVSKDPYACHMDATILPIKPGIVLVNPTRPFLRVNEQDTKNWNFFTDRGWKVIQVPTPLVVKPTFFSSQWLCMNLLNIDDERIIVHKGETEIIKILKNNGMKPIEVDFSAAMVMGGAFHCWSLDVRRRGILQSYF